jgi:peptidoglycan/LPS O-acetylase OafA/YrhL
MTQSKSASSKIPSLDGVRALSFLIVFIAHAGLDYIVPGRFGVNIFFLLSGYLITTLLIRERARTGGISLKLFYARRVLRIFPPLYAVIGGTAIYLAFTHQLAGVTAGGVCSQVFYYQNYWWGGGLIPGLGPLWSLAVEEHFYVLFPPLMLLFFRRNLDYGQITKVLLWVCAGIFIWRCVVVAVFPDGFRWARDASDTRADAILFGCALACLEQTSWCTRLFNRERIERYLAPTSVVVLLATFLIRNEVFRETLRYSLQSLALIPLLWYVVHQPSTAVGKFLNLPALAKLGTLSYSLYLLHAVVIVQVSEAVHSAVLAGLLSFVIALALATVIYLLIEKPTEKLRRQLRVNSSQRERIPSNSELLLASGVQAD